MMRGASGRVRGREKRGGKDWGREKERSRMRGGGKGGGGKGGGGGGKGRGRENSWNLEGNWCSSCFLAGRAAGNIVEI